MSDDILLSKKDLDNLKSDRYDINHIVACDPAGGIAKDRRIPWSCPKDLKFFRLITKGHVVIMGRKTFENIYDRNDGPLEGRVNIVLTNREHYKDSVKDNLYFVSCLDKALCKVRQNSYIGDVFIIGGESLYRQTAHAELIDSVYMTKIREEFECDQLYPSGFLVNKYKSYGSTEEFQVYLDKISESCELHKDNHFILTEYSISEEKVENVTRSSKCK